MPKSRAEAIFCIVGALLLATGFGALAIASWGDVPRLEELELISGRVSRVEHKQSGSLKFGGLRWFSNLWIGETQLYYGGSALRSNIVDGVEIEATISQKRHIYELRLQGRELVSYENEVQASRHISVACAGISAISIFVALIFGRQLRTADLL